MAYRRRQQVGREAPLTYNYDPAPPSADSSSLAAKAIRASSAHRESSLSSVYEQSALSSPRQSPRPYVAPSVVVKESSIYEPPPKKDVNESKQGFWGGLARKAKAIIDDDNPQESPRSPAPLTFDRAQKDQNHDTYTSSGNRRKTDNPSLQKGLDAITSSLNYIGGTIGSALEEGITAVENRTADIIQETRKIQIRKKSGGLASPNQGQNLGSLRQPPMTQARVQPQINADLEMQLKASRDVAMAMAAKAKLLLRELKTVKADLAFAKERCGQLEEENRFLRESGEKGDNPEDDDLIRLQLESLLAEKSRLAQENSVYARENRFLREIVEYHQLTMQDVVYLDEGSEEMTEVYPIKIPPSVTNAQLFGTVTPLTSPTPTIPHGAFSQGNKSMNPGYVEIKETSQDLNTVNPYVQMTGEDSRRY